MKTDGDFRSIPARLLERARRLLETYAARLTLSGLILLSLMPLAEIFGGPQQRIDLIFFGVFATEFVLRLVVYIHARRQGKTDVGEALMLGLDLLATLSFLPIWTLEHGLGPLRVVRLVRMVLLLGYWGAMVRDLWQIVTARERRYQVIFMVLLGAVLSVAGAIIVHDLAPAAGFDGDGDGSERSFGAVLWWSFRQVQDPGNLLSRPGNVTIMIVSLLLTFAGLLLLSFLIGIGTGAIEELMQKSRLKPVGLRNHTVVLGFGEHTHFLLAELAELYTKNRRRLQAAVLGSPTIAPAFMSEPPLDRYVYRQGDPVRVQDLDRVDIHRARRVLILGTDPRDPDAEVISAILATRDRNPTVDIFPDLDHETNLLAARAAGGKRTHIVGSGSFLGDYIAQVAIFPGAYRLYRQLLTSAGCEVYTYIFSEGERSRLRRAVGADGQLDPRVIYARGFEDHAVTLLGFFVAQDHEAVLEVEDLEVALHPTRPSRSSHAFTEDGWLRPGAVRGLIGIALRWEDMRGFAEGLSKDPQRGRIPEPADGLDAFELALPGGPIERVLVFGGSERVPRVLTELSKFYGAIDVSVLVREESRVITLRDDLLAAVERVQADRPDPVPAVFESGPDGVTVSMPAHDGVARVLITHADWSDTNRIVHHPAVDMTRADLLLLMPAAHATREADGLVALDCLQLAHMATRGTMKLRPSFRVVAMMKDPAKGDLLEHRLEGMSDGRVGDRFTVVCGERIRHYFTVQNVFVRGLSGVCLDLLDAERQGFCRLLPRWAGGSPPAEIDPWELARNLLLGHGLVLVGIERSAPDGSLQVVVDPRELRSRIPGSDLEAVLVLGNARPLLSQ